MKINIRLVYLYLFSFVGLLITVFGAVQLVNLGLKVYVFKGVDEYGYYSSPRVPFEENGMKISTEEAKLRDEENQKTQREETKRQRKRDVASALSMIIVGIPLYFYHWKTIQKENKS